MSGSVEKFAPIFGLEIIKESPYEGQNSSEVEEELMIVIKSLIDPDDGLNITFTQEPSTDAIRVFGAKTAKNLLDTNRNIAASGMLYSCTWKDGIIRGKNCGVIGKDLLLLSIRDHRIASAGPSSCGGMKVMMKDLDVWPTLESCIQRWKVASTFPRLSKIESVNKIRTNQFQCIKCILFIVRCYISMQLLKWDFSFLEDHGTLKTKLVSCFGILEHNAPADDNDNTVMVNSSNHKNKSAKSKSRSKTKIIKKKKKSTPVAHNSDLDHTRNVANKRPQYSELTPSSLKRRVSSETNNGATIHHYCSDNNKLAKKSLADTTSSASVVASNIKSAAITTNSNTITTKFVHDLFLTVNKKDENEICSLRIKKQDDVTTEHNNEKNGISHDLLLNLSQKKKNKNEELATSSSTGLIKMPMNLQRAASNVCSGYVSNDNCSSNSAAPNFWCPIDSDELILTPIEIEAAWLVEESIYTTRCDTIDWVFVWKHSSPMLKIKLREITDVGGSGAAAVARERDEAKIKKLLHSTLAAKRFVIVRRDIRRKLLTNKFRKGMELIVPRLRKMTHPLLRKKAAAALQVRHREQN